MVMIHVTPHSHPHPQRIVILCSAQEWLTPVDPEPVCCREDGQKAAVLSVSPTLTRPFRTGHVMAVVVWPFSELR